MPLCKNKRKRFQTKLKQLKMVESRMMEISLKIDNYIYKNKPISLQDAALCIEEVSSYKCQHGKDPRIFQVAEKLIRQLKGVIQEQDSTYTWNVHEVIENSIPVCLPSPTYSDQEIDIVQERDPLGVDDERDGDKTSKPNKNNTIDILTEPITEAKANFANPIDLHGKTSSRLMNDKMFRHEIIKLSDENNGNDCNKIVTKENQINVSKSPIKDIQRSLSQLAIKTVNDEKQRTISLRSVGKVSKCCNQSVDSEMSQTNSSNGKNYYNRDIFVRTEVNEVGNDTVPIKFNSNNETIHKTQLTEDTISQNPPKKRRGRKKTAAKQIEINNSPKEKPKRRRSNKTVKAQQSNDIPVKDTKAVQPQRPLNNKILIHSVIDITPNIRYDPVIPVYNSNVENDLSWIENIRYVREVAPEEIDPKLEYDNNSFWNTFDLPANWNNHDFLY